MLQVKRGSLQQLLADKSTRKRHCWCHRRSSDILQKKKKKDHRALHARAHKREKMASTRNRFWSSHRMLSTQSSYGYVSSDATTNKKELKRSTNLGSQQKEICYCSNELSKIPTSFCFCWFGVLPLEAAVVFIGWISCTILSAADVVVIQAMRYLQLASRHRWLSSRYRALALYKPGALSAAFSRGLADGKNPFTSTLNLDRTNFPLRSNAAREKTIREVLSLVRIEKTR